MPWPTAQPRQRCGSVPCRAGIKGCSAPNNTLDGVDGATPFVEPVIVEFDAYSTWPLRTWSPGCGTVSSDLHLHLDCGGRLSRAVRCTAAKCRRRPVGLPQKLQWATCWSFAEAASYHVLVVQLHSGGMLALKLRQGQAILNFLQSGTI